MFIFTNERKKKTNGHKEKRGKQAFKRIIHQRDSEHKEFQSEFGQHHKSAVITLIERLSKVIITLKPKSRQAIDIENSLNKWFKLVPKIYLNR